MFGEPFDRLPEAIKARLTRKEYAWLSDREKNNLVAQFTSPELDAEDPPP